MPHSRDEILVLNPTNVKTNQVVQLHGAASWIAQAGGFPELARRESSCCWLSSSEFN